MKENKRRNYSFHLLTDFYSEVNVKQSPISPLLKTSHTHTHTHTHTQLSISHILPDIHTHTHTAFYQPHITRYTHTHSFLSATYYHTHTHTHIYIQLICWITQDNSVAKTSTQLKLAFWEGDKNVLAHTMGNPWGIHPQEQWDPYVQNKKKKK